MKPRAIIYTRVSSDKQIEGTSLNEQERLCREFSQKRGFEVVKLFREEGESAKTAKRPLLLESLNFCSKKENKIDYFLVYKVDRFSRNVADYHALKALLSQYNVELLSATEDFRNDAAGKLNENILAVFSQYFNDLNSERSKLGSMARFKEGKLTRRPPIGYTKDYYNKEKIKPAIPDTNFEGIKLAWELMLTGKYTLREICLKLNCRGVKTHLGGKIATSTLYDAFRNKFYCGYIVSKKNNLVVKSTHKPMITEAEFYTVQSILSRPLTNISKPYGELTTNFYLSRTLRCSNCNHLLTGGFAKRKYGYYRCYNKSCNKKDQITKEDVENKFTSLLATFMPDEEFLLCYKEYVTNKYSKIVENKKNTQKMINREVRNLEDRIEKIEELLEKGVYSIDRYKEKVQKIQEELVVKRMELTDANINLDDFTTALNYSIKFLQLLPNFWISLSDKDRRSLHLLLFPKGVIYQNEELATPEKGNIIRAFGDLEVVKNGLELTVEQICNIVNDLFNFYNTVRNFNFQLLKVAI